MFGPGADVSWLAAEPAVVSLEVHDFFARRFGVTVRQRAGRELSGLHPVGSLAMRLHCCLAACCRGEPETPAAARDCAGRERARGRGIRRDALCRGRGQ